MVTYELQGESLKRIKKLEVLLNKRRRVVRELREAAYKEECRIDAEFWNLIFKELGIDESEERYEITVINSPTQKYIITKIDNG